MPRNLGNIVRLRPPFGGLDLDGPARSAGPLNARYAQNVITSHGSIDVRDPVQKWTEQSLLYHPSEPLDSLAGVSAMYPFQRSQVSPLDHFLYLRAWGQRGGEPRALHSCFHWNSETGTWDYVAQSNNSVFTTEPWGPPPTLVGESKLIVVDPSSNLASRELVDSATWQGLGIEKPAASPWIEQSNGTLNGKFSYRITWYNAGTLVESGPSPEGITNTVVNQGFAIHRGDPPGDPQVTHWKVYRMQIEGTPLDDGWYLLGSMEISDSLMLDGYGNSLNKTYQNRLLPNVDRPPPAYAVIYHKGRAWYADARYHGRLVHSEYNKPEVVNFLNSYSTGTRRIIGLLSLGDYLYVLTYDGLWAVGGDGVDSFALQQIGTAEFLAPSGVLPTPVGLFTAGRRGIYEVAGDGATLISKQIGPWWKQHTAEQLFGVSAAYDGYHNLLIFNVPGAAVQYVYNVDNKQWTHWTIDAWAVGSVAVPHHPERPVFAMRGPVQVANRLLGAVGDALLWKDLCDSWSQPIAFSWRTPDLDLGMLGKKKFYYVKCAWDIQDLGATTDGFDFAVKVNQTIGNASEQWKSLDVPAVENNGGMATQKVGEVGDTITAKVSGAIQRRLRFTSLEIDAEPAGYR